MKLKELKVKTLKSLSGLTPKEKEMYVKAFDIEMKMLKNNGLLDEDGLPDDRQLDEWKISMDKNMIQKLVKRIHKTIFNYRRKIFGVSSMAPEPIIAEEINHLMKELIEIRYTNWEAWDKFFEKK